MTQEPLLARHVSRTRRLPENGNADTEIINRLCLICFPHLFGILLAATIQESPLIYTVQQGTVILCASFFVSNAIHIWNDLIDAPLDRLVERTRFRPIPRGAVSPFSALIFTLTQALGAMLFLPLMPCNFLSASLYAFPGIIGWTYYPWAKRHTNFPQLVVGFCLGWGVVMGSLAVGIETFNTSVGLSVLCLSLASMLWTAINDAIYAHQDREEDIKVGIKSMAVLYGERTKPILYQLLTLMFLLLLACGWLGQLLIPYFTIAVGGATISLGLMIARVDLNSTQSCWWWFSNGFWYVGGSITGGLFLEYVSRLDSSIH